MSGRLMKWHINCLELLAVLLALRRLLFQPIIQVKHVLVRSDSTSDLNLPVAASSGVSTYIPGALNQTANALSSQDSLREDGASIPAQSSSFKGEKEALSYCMQTEALPDSLVGYD